MKLKVIRNFSATIDASEVYSEDDYRRLGFTNTSFNKTLTVAVNGGIATIPFTTNGVGPGSIRKQIAVLKELADAMDRVGQDGCSCGE